MSRSSLPLLCCACAVALATGCAALAGLDEEFSVGTAGGVGTSTSTSTGTATGVGGGTSTGTATGVGGGTSTGTAVGGGTSTGTAVGGGTSTGATGGGGGAVTACGNGVIDAGEECDDGARDPDDGCSADCAVECVGAQSAKEPVTHHCYRYLDATLVGWNAGRAACQALGTGWDLAVITTAGERNFVDDVLALPEGTQFANNDPYQYWLGGRDLSQTDVFEWIDGEPWSYAPWDTDPPDPSHGNQDCIRLRAIQGTSNDVFRDAECTLGSSVLCELEPAGSP